MKKIFFGIILLVFLSCNKDIKDPTAQINAFGFTNIQEARENLGIYAGFLKTLMVLYISEVDNMMVMFLRQIYSGGILMTMETG
jgi:hypothetical protein